MDRIDYVLTVINKAETFCVSLSSHIEAENMAVNIRKMFNPYAIFIQEIHTKIILDEEGEYLYEETESELIGDY